MKQSGNQDKSNMLEETVKDYAAYINFDVSSGFQTVQDAIDNMLTRLEELTSVLHMIKLKNSECSVAVAEDINKYRTEITALSKKVITVNDVISTLQNNADLLEKQIERAEIDFGVNNNNKLKSFLKTFLVRNKVSEPVVQGNIVSPNKLKLKSVLENFEHP